MRLLLLGMQYIGILVLFAESLVIFRRWKNRLQGYLFLNCIAVLVNNIGYLFELRSTSIDSYITALQISYAGRVWIGLCLFLFVGELTRKHIPEMLKNTLVVSGIISYALILTLRSHKLYYTYVTFENSGIFPMLDHGNGIWHHLLMAQQVVYIFFGLYWIFLDIQKEHNTIVKRRLFLVLSAIFIEGGFFIIQVIGIPGITGVYDVTMIGYFMGTIIMLIAILSFDLLGTRELAREFVIDKIAEGIIAVDDEGAIRYFNEPAKELFPDLKNDSTDIPDAILDAVRNKDSITIGDRMYGPQASELVHDGANFGQVYVLVDETEHYHYMKELEEQKEIADRANEAKGIFLANMTHEIRTPINAVLGMDEMILRESRQEEILEYADNIKTAGTTLLGLVNDVLDMSKIESGKMDLIENEYKVVSIINDLSVMIDLRAEAKGLEYNVDIDPTIPNTLYGDDGHLKQVVANILTNAVKYTEKGGVTLHVKKVSLIRDKITLRFCVEDTGIGIKEEDMPKLFAAFERIEEKRNRNIEGTGLGMSITVNLLSMMDSKLNCESVYGEGSKFYFEVSQKIVSDEPIGDYQAAVKKMHQERRASKLSFTAPAATILVVDDTPMNLSVIRNLLKKTRIAVETAQSGMECLKKISHTHYDIIFLDERMPKLSGTETLEQMGQFVHANEDTPVISMTANSQPDAREHYRNEGFSDYLAKPVIPKLLEETIVRYLPADKVILGRGEDDEQPDGFLDEALGIYLNSLDENIAGLAECFEKKDWAGYTIKVHSIKSTSRVIGEEGLGELAEKLENAGTGLDVSFIEKNHIRFINWYRSLAVKYAGVDYKSTQETADESKSSKPEISEEEVNEAFSAISELSHAYDDESIGSILDMLEERTLPENCRETYNKLKHAFERLDWEAMEV